MNRRAFAWLLVLALPLGFAGCGGGKGNVKKVSVSGKVTLDSEPIADITVYFVGEYHTGTGVTASDGSYELATGATPGENLIYFTMGGSEPVNEDEGLDPDQFRIGAESGSALPGASEGGPQLPERYTDPGTSNIKFEVPSAGATDADFRLSSKT